ncbi:MAG: FtsW/RodA/SpoVE family cell cycle protein [Oscillospiraceae bacterium]|nr:FtsW/RodA/SpoVE family cell cycle protein [Oscillospiraceae bacterium]
MAKKIFAAIGRYIKKLDKILLLMCLACSAISLILLKTMYDSDMPRVYSRTLKVQILAVCIGVVVAIIVSLFDYHFLAKLWKLHLPISIALVALTFFIGLGRAGADDRAWINLPMGLTLQPSEILKLSFILSFALHLENVRDKINSPLTLLTLGVHAAIPVVLVRLQGDDGTMLIFIFIIVSMLFAAGLSWKYLVGGIVAIGAASPLIWKYVLTADQRARFAITYNLESDPLGQGYQQLEGLTAIGRGSVLGKGFAQESYWWTPEIHNDFIFAFAGEVLGLVGAIGIIVLLFGISVKLIISAVKAKDGLGAYICIGICAMFTFQTILNIGMCLSVLPVIGVTLPLISAGGTSVVTMYAGLGLALGVHSHREKSMFDR